ncbi:MAG: flagellar biosynthesis protein FlgN [Treponema sp.]|nr:flagellar biosynthesis protein FlgN [Treponema sp.]
METKLSQEELNERIQILKKFRQLLEQQRTKFQEYLKVLEAQESKINEENAEALLAHSELEAQIVKGIGSLQKVIVPMQDLVTRTHAATYNPADAKPIEDIKAELAKLQGQVLKQNEKNRNLLKFHMAQIKEQIQEFKNPYRSLNSVYFTTMTTGSRIQVEV